MTSKQQINIDATIIRDILYTIPNKWWKDLREFKVLSPDYQKMLDAIPTWDFETYPSFTILSPKTGIGKTLISVTILRFVIYKKLSTLTDMKDVTNWAGLYKTTEMFWNEADIYGEIMASYKDKYMTEKEAIDKFVRLPVLVIDDLFCSEVVTPFNTRVMYSILNKRIDWHSRPTIITSNLTLKEIGSINSRIASRISNKYLYQYSGDKLIDMRQELNK